MAASRQIAIRLSLEDAQKVREGLRAIGEDGKAALQSLETASVRAASSTAQIGNQAQTAGSRMDQFRGVMGQAGFQVQDFATQVSMGGNALQALGVQGSQLLGAFGPTGAIAGAVLMVGTLATQFLTAGDNAEVAKTKGQEALDAMTKSARETASVLRDINSLFLTASQRAATLANNQRAELRARAETRLGEVETGRTELGRRIADEQQFLSDINRPNGPYYRAESNADRNREAEAIVRLKDLQSQAQAADREVDRLRQSLQQLDKAGVLGAEEFGPERPQGLPQSVDAISRQLDRARTIREEYAGRVAVINSSLAAGSVEQEEATRLLRLAEQDRDKSLQALTASSGRMTAAQRDANKEMEAALRVQAELYGTPVRTASGLDAIGAMDERVIREIQGRQRATERAGEETKRAADKYAKDWEDAYKEQQRANRRVTDDIVRYGADAFADMFDKNGKGWKGLLDTFETTFRRTMARIAAEAIIRPVVSPIVQGLGLGNTSGFGSTGGLLSAGSALSPMALKGLPVTDGGGSLVGYAKGLGSLFDNGMIGGGGSFQTGLIGRFDRFAETNIGGFLDTPAYTIGGNSELASQLGAFQDTGMTVGEVGSSVSGTTVSIGNAALGAAGVAAGAYGLYSAAQTGGAKGWAQGVGSVAGIGAGATTLAGGASAVGAGATAAMGATAGTIIGGLATVAPYLAAIAMIVAQFLPAQKPSNREGNSTIDFGDGSVFSGGATGGKFSQENRDAAKSLTDAIGSIADRIETAYGVQLEGRMSVGVGDRDGMYLTRNGRDKLTFTADEKGSTDLLQEATKRIVEGIAGQLEGAMATTYAKVGTGDLDRLLGALDWTSTTYKAFEDNKDPEKPTSYDQQIKAITDAYEPLIAKAKEYGLALQPISDVMDEQLKAVEKARNSDFEKLLQDYRVTASQLMGQDQTTEALKQFDQARTAAWLALEAQIKDWNLPDSDVAKATAGFDRVQDLQRAALQRQTTRAAEDREASAADIRNSLRNAYLEATGNSEAGVLSYTQQRDNEWRALKRQMEDLDFAFGDIVASSEEFNAVTQANIKVMRDKTTTDRLSAEQNALTRIGSVQGTLVDFLNGMNISAASPQNAFTAAQEQFAAEISKARTAGIQGIDAGRVTSAADALLQAGSAYLGDGAQGAFLRQTVESQVRSLGASLDLPAFGGSIDRATAAINPLTDQVAALRQEIARLREEIVTTRLRTAA
ncbi:hypothetical protein [Roseomonas populi]|uniref:Bacteriophage tail tape measure N-terminal domain-containing protein n=1 Tax=Roseomonas populi TaxID=3121582 RepID=A0ABT1WXQ8_9PROT|nr:hypothetical protein [Roseomonas pecuniae]MCR0980620.1 hypothetical protein [Roseomonas pecuniae]